MKERLRRFVLWRCVLDGFSSNEVRYFWIYFCRFRANNASRSCSHMAAWSNETGKIVLVEIFLLTLS